MYHRVYGEGAFAFEPGQAEFFDLMLGQLFAEVWSRPGLDVASRRLVLLGVLAAQHRFDILELQFARALETGELTAEAVREVVIQLIPYVGYPSSGDLYRAGESAIAAAEA
jgi:4-carboxymuconolactone decarboxylase